MEEMQAMAPHPNPLPCATAFPPPRLVPAGALISWSKNASCSRIHPEQAAPLSRHDDERRHAIHSHSVLTLRFHLAACSPSSSCRFWVLDHLCSNLSQSFHLRWITEIRSLNLCVCFTFSSSVFTFLIEIHFSFKSLFALWSLSPQRFHYHFSLV